MLQQCVKFSITGYRKLLIAFSGGLDSTVLLHAITVLLHDTSIVPFTLRAIHIHHGLNHNADQWALHCEKQCQRYGIVCKTVRIDLKNHTGGNIESIARSARYRVLVEQLCDEEVLLTAHHQDDQAETFLLALKRGSGPAGLSAMSTNTYFYGHRLIRPLLNTSRARLEYYAHTNHLSWIEDDSNSDTRFDRNFLRLKILPLLKQRWMKFSEAVARSAQLCSEQEALLDELLENTLMTLTTPPDGSLKLTMLKSMSSVHRMAILRRWLARHDIRMPSRSQLICLWEEVVLSRRDATPQLRIDGKILRRFRDCLYVVPVPVSPRLNYTIIWPKRNAQLLLPNRLGVLIRRFFTRANDTTTDNTWNSRRMGGTVVVHSIIRAPFQDEEVSVRLGGMSRLVHSVGRRHSRTVKKLWQELGIPPWQRGEIPMLFYNETLIAILGALVTQEGEVKPNREKEKWCMTWCKKYH